MSYTYQLSSNKAADPTIRVQQDLQTLNSAPPDIGPGPYGVLKVPQSAAYEEIRMSFINLEKKAKAAGYAKEAEEKRINELQAAIMILSNRKDRQAYDLEIRRQYMQLYPDDCVATRDSRVTTYGVPWRPNWGRFISQRRPLLDSYRPGRDSPDYRPWGQ